MKYLNGVEALTRAGMAAAVIGAGYLMAPKSAESAPAQHTVDPGKMVVDFEPEAGSRAFISARWFECIVMGDTVLEIDGQRLDTKDGYKGNPKVGSMTRVFNRNFRVEPYAKIDIWCVPTTIPETGPFANMKYAEFVDNMRRNGCVGGCDLIQERSFGTRQTAMGRPWDDRVGRYISGAQKVAYGIQKAV